MASSVGLTNGFLSVLKDPQRLHLQAFAKVKLMRKFNLESRPIVVGASESGGGGGASSPESEPSDFARSAASPLRSSSPSIDPSGLRPWTGQ